MARRNPNGYGCVTKLSGNRKRPWCVKVTIYDSDGFPKQVPVGYASTQEDANILLAQYNNNPWNISRETVTLVDLYKQWSQMKMPKLGLSNQQSLRSAFGHCTKYYGYKYRSLRAYQMQDCIDNCGLGTSSKNSIKSLWGHLDRFAFELDIIDKMYSQLTTAESAPETSRTPFTEEEIEKLWNNIDEPYVDTVLIYIYTGFRLMELLSLTTDQVNLEEMYIKGGLKTNAGKERIVPIHPRIQPLVTNLMSNNSTYLFLNPKGKKFSKYVYYQIWHPLMNKLNISKTPHEARHTLETLLDNAGGNRKCIDLIMGHKSSDIGNRVYNHKTLQQLRDTINLIK